MLSLFIYYYWYSFLLLLCLLLVCCWFAVVVVAVVVLLLCFCCRCWCCSCIYVALLLLISLSFPSPWLFFPIAHPNPISFAFASLIYRAPHSQFSSSQAMYVGTPSTPVPHVSIVPGPDSSAVTAPLNGHQGIISFLRGVNSFQAARPCCARQARVTDNARPLQTPFIIIFLDFTYLSSISIYITSILACPPAKRQWTRFTILTPSLKENCCAFSVKLCRQS